MAQVLSREHHSLEVLLSKMAATIMPSTHAQYCTIFIPSDQASVMDSEVRDPFHYVVTFDSFFFFVCWHPLTSRWVFCPPAGFNTDFILTCDTLGVRGARINLPDLQKVFTGLFKGPGWWFISSVLGFLFSNIKKSLFIFSGNTTSAIWIHRSPAEHWWAWKRLTWQRVPWNQSGASSAALLETRGLKRSLVSSPLEFITFL